MTTDFWMVVYIYTFTFINVAAYKCQNMYSKQSIIKVQIDPP